MGTVVSFDVYGPAGSTLPERAYAALARARASLQRADAVFSLWKPDSPMSRLRRGELALGDAPPEIGEVLDRCEEARRLSDGWFDPWAMPGGLDPTGLVKGWAAQRARDLLVHAGCADVLVNAGGDVAVAGSPDGRSRWRVGIQHPVVRDALLAVLEVDAAVATSGTYERGEHLVDPRSGQRRTRFASASVTGPDLAIADAMATALVVAGPEGVTLIESLPGYEALAVERGGRFWRTAGLLAAELPGGAPPTTG